MYQTTIDYTTPTAWRFDAFDWVWRPESLVYLIHFERPISERSTTQHYLGWTNNLNARMRLHERGRGSRLTAVAVARGIAFRVVRVWPGDRRFERQLKRRHNSRRLCPVCQQLHPVADLRDFDIPW